MKSFSPRFCLLGAPFLLAAQGTLSAAPTDREGAVKDAPALPWLSGLLPRERRNWRRLFARRNHTGRMPHCRKQGRAARRARRNHAGRIANFSQRHAARRAARRSVAFAAQQTDHSFAGPICTASDRKNSVYGANPAPICACRRSLLCRHNGAPIKRLRQPRVRLRRLPKIYPVPQRALFRASP